MGVKFKQTYQQYTIHCKFLKRRKAERAVFCTLLIGLTDFTKKEIFVSSLFSHLNMNYVYFLRTIDSLAKQGFFEVVEKCKLKKEKNNNKGKKLQTKGRPCKCLVNFQKEYMKGLYFFGKKKGYFLDKYIERDRILALNSGYRININLKRKKIRCRKNA